MNNLFKKVNLNSSFFVASEIIKLISDNNPCDRLDELLYINSQSHQGFMNDFLNNNISRLETPQKRTLLHSFIEQFFYCLIGNDFYCFKS